ncbi:TPA: hemolysin XhlA family protein [Clostridioides difficile]|uniref:hemolysin XhlA family protein n=1 Tax=Clostridioides TaxID=1870884 RepID=UPI00038C7D00|nr:hemolysin XhlA family protein [Clostridioides difficile]MCC0629111.1 hemolysin XhlA family protein [Clostridioides sp. ES-S-0171-01]MCC0633629.1 hemolysin XhlA family protein [Clostridioides sp. ZZV15-6388]MCC0688898.1 hemolysin XhlA family protein [Clostridioides sp. ES-S-0056-01]MCC0716141.1 hemolysin XhlA family protein [Clostridioides sp. ES-S-0077-01]UDN53479.1 hemolysin XhlA family protein [Clostridioides sp. ES-S-0054-01]UDN56906.1 hemolysin XhlA family protein [Clostridioides sp. E
MNEELFKDNLKRHEVTINKHNDEIDELKVANIESKAELKALCENLNSLTSMLKWLIGTMITTLIGFFIFAIQRGIF